MKTNPRDWILAIKAVFKEYGVHDTLLMKGSGESPKFRHGGILYYITTVHEPEYVSEKEKLCMDLEVIPSYSFALKNMCVCASNTRASSLQKILHLVIESLDSTHCSRWTASDWHDAERYYVRLGGKYGQ